MWLSAGTLCSPTLVLFLFLSCLFVFVDLVGFLHSSILFSSLATSFSIDCLFLSIHFFQPTSAITVFADSFSSFTRLTFLVLSHSLVLFLSFQRPLPSPVPPFSPIKGSYGVNWMTSWWHTADRGALMPVCLHELLLNGGGRKTPPSPRITRCFEMFSDLQLIFLLCSNLCLFVLVLPISSSLKDIVGYGAKDLFFCLPLNCQDILTITVNYTVQMSGHGDILIIT